MRIILRFGVFFLHLLSLVCVIVLHTTIFYNFCILSTLSVQPLGVLSLENRGAALPYVDVRQPFERSICGCH
jgi:hypothetical protein